MTSPYVNVKQKIISEAFIKAFGIKPAINEMPTPPGSEGWPVLTEYDLTQSNQKPVEATPIQLGYQIEKLERDLAFEKESLRKVKQEYQTYMDDYKRLDMDYLNSQYKVKQLQAQVDKIPTLKHTIRYMMAEHLDIELGDE